MAWFSRRMSPAQESAKMAAATAAAANPPADQHTLRAFGEALARVSSATAQMGDLVVRMVRESAPVFLERDAARAKAIIELDLEVDRQKDALLSQTMEILARHQPVASDLRLLLAIERIAANLERAADHAKNIAKRTLSISSPATLDHMMADLMRRLHSEVSSMLSDSLRAFATRDTALALDIGRRDLEPDAINDDLFHSVIAKIQTNPAEAAADIQALFVGKALERIGDHATNIADEVRFLAHGEAPSATRPK